MQTHSNRNKRLRRRRRAARMAALLITGTLLITSGACIGYKTAISISYKDDAVKLSPNFTSLNTTSTSSDPAPVKTPTNSTDWNLILVNSKNLIPEKYDVTLKKLKNGHSVDERCYPDLQRMMDDCRAAGLSPLICSSYRTSEKQKSLYDKKVKSFTAQGYNTKKAEALAAEIVAAPGTSEHQLGLAVDIVDTSYQTLDKKQEKTAVQQWLMKNSYKYGFIIRYPSGKSDLTGVQYEPWHYRYVGIDAAKEIYEQGLCLEEYLSALSTSK